jgi:hypothetical protein
LKYSGNLGEDISEDGGVRIEHITRFGRSFSVITVPYTMKLLIQELQCMNIQLRVITEDNIKQLESMSYKEIKDPAKLIQSIKNKLSSTRTESENEWRYIEPEHKPENKPEPENRIITPEPDEDGWQILPNKEGRYSGDIAENIDWNQPTVGGEQIQKIDWNTGIIPNTYQEQQIGEHVYLRGDINQQRIWVIKDISPNGFITIETEDIEDGEDSIKIVNADDIILPQDVIYEQPLHMQPQFIQPQFMQNQNPLMSIPNPGSGITISPVINNIIGNNDKNNDDYNNTHHLKTNNKTKQKLEETQNRNNSENNKSGGGETSGEKSGGLISNIFEFGKNMLIKKVG